MRYLGVSKPVSDEAADDEARDGQRGNESGEEMSLSGLEARERGVPLMNDT